MVKSLANTLLRVLSKEADTKQGKKSVSVKIGTLKSIVPTEKFKSLA